MAAPQHLQTESEHAPNFLRVLNSALIEQLAPPDVLIDWMRNALRAVSARRATMPPRWMMKLRDDLGSLGFMPGHLDGAGAGVKLVSLVPEKRRRGSSHLGLMVLYDEDGLVPVALLCGATLTSLRTAAVSAAATDALALTDAKILAILGTGEQAEQHLRFLPYVRAFDEIRIWGRSREKADQLALKASDNFHGRLIVYDTTEEVVDAADVICTTTSASTPILQTNQICAGTHVNLVGSSHKGALEVDASIVQASSFFVDNKEFALLQAAELLSAIAAGSATQADIAGEIGQVIAGDMLGRQSPDEITIFKSLGHSAEDIFAARRILDEAVRRELGVNVAI